VVAAHEFSPTRGPSERKWGETRAYHEFGPSRDRERVEWGETRGDRAVRALAAQQHGLVTTRQLAAAGISKDAITWRLANGRLARHSHGIYLVGPLQAQFTPEMAAVLACGPTALLSHDSAAALWGFRPRPRHPHVTVTRGDPRPAGVSVHRATPHASLEAAVHHALPLTTPTRTLHDLAATLTQRDLDRAVEQAQILRLPIETSTARRGAAKLKQALRSDPRMTRSEAEARLLALIRAARLPTPRTNARIGRHEVDLVWDAQRVIVEVDGFAYHGTREAFERDRVRDAELQAAGYRVVRVTWRMIVEEPEALVARLAALLA
jgi:very-short-patch-repair endonuclease